jgi:hypothetical protein
MAAYPAFPLSLPPAVTTVNQHKRMKQRLRNLMNKLWIWEVVAAALSIAFLLATFILMVVYYDKEISS